MGFHPWLYVHDMNVSGLRLWRFGFVSFRSKTSVFVNKQFSCFRSLLSTYVFVVFFVFLYRPVSQSWDKQKRKKDWFNSTAYC